MATVSVDNIEEEMAVLDASNSFAFLLCFAKKATETGIKYVNFEPKKSKILVVVFKMLFLLFWIIFFTSLSIDKDTKNKGIPIIKILVLYLKLLLFSKGLEYVK